MNLGHIVHFTNTRSPSLTDTITSDGVAVDLTGCTLKFQMRLVGSSTLKVDAAATIVTPAAGTVRYDWASADVNTSGYYVGWWHVTLSGGTTQDTPEFLVEIRDHASISNEYVSVEELKNSLSLQQESFADSDVQIAIAAASRAIDSMTGRRFWLDAAASNVRTYVPVNSGFCQIDDLTTLTTLSVGGSNWTVNTDFYLEPENANLDGQPWTGIRALGKPFLWSTSDFGPGYVGIDPRISVTGAFGWPAVPPEIVQATRIYASRLLKRGREAAFGVIGLGIDGGAITIARQDPDVAMLVNPYATVWVA